MSDPQCFHLSASSISAFKACPTRFRLGYREGLRTIQDTESQRVGTNWHTLHEIYYEDLLSTQYEGWTDERRKEHAVNAAIEHIDERYATHPCPTSKTLDEWDTERQRLVTCFIGYLWYWESEPIDSLMSELAFDLPLHAPKTGLPLLIKEVVRVGKIDHIAVWRDKIVNVERKSTARSIDPSSDYWEKAEKDTQVSMYALAFQDLCRSKELPDLITGHTAFQAEKFGDTLYDVWHKPTTKPVKLTQANTTLFVETGEYMGNTFKVQCLGSMPDENIEVTVNGTEVEVTLGKKGYAIRETPAMYAARLLSDIYERPEFYFQRKEIARTAQEIQQFRVELFNIYQAQRLFDQTGCWFENEYQCRATFPCAYLSICYGPGSNNVCDGKTQVAGFKRIFVDVSVDNQNLNEGE